MSQTSLPKLVKEKHGHAAVSWDLVFPWSWVWAAEADGNHRCDLSEVEGRRWIGGTHKTRREGIHDSSLGLFQQSSTWIFNPVEGNSYMTLRKEGNYLNHERSLSTLPTSPWSEPFQCKPSDFQLPAPGLSLRALPGPRHWMKVLTKWPSTTDWWELAPYLPYMLCTTPQLPKWDGATVAQGDDLLLHPLSWLLSLIPSFQLPTQCPGNTSPINHFHWSLVSLFCASVSLNVKWGEEGRASPS